MNVLSHLLILLFNIVFSLARRTGTSGTFSLRRSLDEVSGASMTSVNCTSLLL